MLAIDRPQATELWKLHAKEVSPTMWNDDWDGSPLVLNDFLFEGGENSQLHIVKLNRATGADGLVTVLGNVLNAIDDFNRRNSDLQIRLSGDAILSLVLGMGNDAFNNLRDAAPDALANILRNLTSVIDDFNQRHPDLQIRLTNENACAILAMVLGLEKDQFKNLLSGDMSVLSRALDNTVAAIQEFNRQRPDFAIGLDGQALFTIFSMVIRLGVDALNRGWAERARLARASHAGHCQAANSGQCAGVSRRGR